MRLQLLRAERLRQRASRLLASRFPGSFLILYTLVPPTGQTVNRQLRQLLESWRSAGLSHLPRATAEAQSRVAALISTELPVVDEVPVAATELSPAPERRVERLVPVTTEPAPVPLVTGKFVTLEERSAALQHVSCRVADCRKCSHLAESRTQTVFGVGNPLAKVMFIGEAPGADEDAQGEPFVGKAGQLLNKIIGACGWKREEIYICNILRCRPPGNRTPEKPEADNCREYLDAQIQIIDPDYIVCWGSCAAQNLLDSTLSIGKMRGNWYQHGRAKVLCTYHPSYLLRNPDAKKPVWEDMKLLLAEMGLTPPGNQ